jgi:hypothetical protein
MDLQVNINFMQNIARGIENSGSSFREHGLKKKWELNDDGNCRRWGGI